MSEPKHTPGPWFVTESDWESGGHDMAVIYDETGEEVLGISEWIRISEPDLILMSQAWQLPDLRKENTELKEINKVMYEVLAGWEEAFNNHLPESKLGMLISWGAFEEARKALRKARGETE